jgi:hypothetical protein
MKHYSNKPLPSSSSMCPPGDGHLHPNPFESAPSGQVDTSQAGHLSFSNSLVGHWKALKNWKKTLKSIEQLIYLEYSWILFSWTYGMSDLRLLVYWHHWISKGRTMEPINKAKLVAELKTSGRFGTFTTRQTWRFSEMEMGQDGQAPNLWSSGPLLIPKSDG